MKTKAEKTKQRLRSMRMNSVREDQKTQGYFDGRFQNRSIPDKRKEANKYASRKPINIYAL
jgi:hypothetical protein